MVVDIGLEIEKVYVNVIKGVKLVFWNGLMGVFEIKGFEFGIKVVVQVFIEVDGFLVVGGGDFVFVVCIFGFVDDQFGYIFIGGGVFFEFMEGKKLFGIVVFKENN